MSECGGVVGCFELLGKVAYRIVVVEGLPSLAIGLVTIALVGSLILLGIAVFRKFQTGGMDKMNTANQPETFIRINMRVVVMVVLSAGAFLIWLSFEAFRKVYFEWGVIAPLWLYTSWEAFKETERFRKGGAR